MTKAEDRYRTFLDASSAVAGLPTIKAVLHSLRDVLSRTSRLHGAVLCLLDDDENTLHVLEFDREADAPPIKIGAKISRTGAVAQVLEQQKPVFLPDVSKDMLINPELAPFAPESIGRSTYMFPVSTSQQRYGVLLVTKDRWQKFLPEDVDMLRATAGHVAVALESALARDSAELYEREAEKERDRLKLLLEINNHIASKLEVNELFHAVGQSLRKYFGNDLTSFWLFNTQSSCLECKFLDFLTGRGILAKVTVALPSRLESELWHLRKPVLYSPSGSETPPALREAAQAESLLSAVAVPLIGANGPLGLFNVASHKADAFCQEDLDLLSQIGTQLSLALDNALAYEALGASRDDLRRKEAYLTEAQRLSHTGSFAFDVASNKYVYISEECLRIFELDAQQSLPPREAVSRLIHPEDWDRVQRDFEKLLREKVDTPSEFRIVLPSGAVKHILVARQPVLNSTGDVITIVGTAVDITERVRSENELRRSETQLAHERDRFSLLLEINNHIANKLEASELFQAVAASMRKHLGTDAISVWLINKHSGSLERKYLDFPTDIGFFEKVVARVPANLESEWWRLRKPVLYSPPGSDTPVPLREAARAESLLSAVAVPLVGANGPLGLFNVASRTGDAFGQADLDLLSQIGTQISLALDNALAYGRLRASRDNLEDQRLYLESEISSEYRFEDVVGKSPAIKRVLQQVSVVAPTDSIVLLHGETGTGKELIARAIHNLSSRRDRTFVRMNCAAIPSGLLESELFGHEKGAFTGALMQRRGRFELADHGSLFLDEIGDISLELQPKLLRAVQEQEFERLGSAKTIHVNVRIIVATHRDLRAMICEGRFREDLFYRLKVFPIEIPPLRERREDIPLLVNHFVSHLSRRMGKKIKSIPTETMEALTNNPWRGNVRELANFIERAVILTQGDELEVPLAELRTSSLVYASAAMSLTVQEAERAMINDALRAASGRISGSGGAAERLGLKRTTLQNKMRRLGITPNFQHGGSSAF